MRASDVRPMDIINGVMIDEIRPGRSADMIRLAGVDLRTGHRRELVRFVWEKAEDPRQKPRPWEELAELRRMAREGRLG